MAVFSPVGSVGPPGAGLKRDPKNADLKGALADLDKAVAKRGH